MGGGGGGDDWDLEAAQAAVAESAYMEKAQAAMRVAFMRKVRVCFNRCMGR